MGDNNDYHTYKKNIQVVRSPLTKGYFPTHANQSDPHLKSWVMRNLVQE